MRIKTNDWERVTDTRAGATWVIRTPVKCRLVGITRPFLETRVLSFSRNLVVISRSCIGMEYAWQAWLRNIFPRKCASLSAGHVPCVFHSITQIENPRWRDRGVGCMLQGAPPPDLTHVSTEPRKRSRPRIENTQWLGRLAFNSSGAFDVTWNISAVEDPRSMYVKHSE